MPYSLLALVGATLYGEVVGVVLAVAIVQAVRRERGRGAGCERVRVEATPRAETELFLPGLLLPF